MKRVERYASIGQCCTVDGCSRLVCHKGHLSKRLCQLHKLRIARTGSTGGSEPIKGSGKPRQSAEDRRARELLQYKKYYQDNRAKALALSKEWARNNPEIRKAIQKKYNNANKGYYREALSRRRDALRRATPPWVNRAALRKIYANRPDGYHVDHIISLQAENVCGLHVPWNLQYLPHRENSAKQNKFCPATYVRDYPTPVAPYGD